MEKSLRDVSTPPVYELDRPRIHHTCTTPLNEPGASATGHAIHCAPELRGCHTQAKSLDKLMERIREAIALCTDSDEHDQDNEFIGIQRIAV